MRTDKNNKSAKFIIFLCWAAYMAAYLGRLNFNAYIEPMRAQISASKTELGLVSSFFFFSYGAGQLVHGILSRKYNTRYSVAVALIGSAATNFMMTFSESASAMKYIWLLNGFFQSILWSSVVKTLSDRLSDEMLSSAIVAMSTPVAVGTFIVYGLSALLSARGVGYKWVFYIPSALLLAVGIIWFVSLEIADRKLVIRQSGPPQNKPKKLPKLTPCFVLLALPVLLAAIANGFIKDGVTTWTPSILKENYGMKESMSILITVILPLIAVFGAWLATALYKKLKSSFKADGVLYLVEVIVIISVIFVSKRDVSTFGTVTFVALFAVSSMLMSAVNSVITAVIPMYMREKADSGLLAGVLDTFCYVGSTMSTGLLGFIADRDSWNGVFICLLVFGAVACAVSFAGGFAEKRNVD